LLQLLDKGGLQHRHAIRRATLTINATLRHIGEFKTHNLDTIVTQSTRHRRHEIRIHPGPSTMGQHDGNVSLWNRWCIDQHVHRVTSLGRGALLSHNPRPMRGMLYVVQESSYLSFFPAVSH